jgi:nucleotide-binding universal stress UspA family protein
VDHTAGVFTRIVVAYDDSSGARHALWAAIALAKAGKARVVAVAVEAHLPHYGATVGEVDEELAVEERACRRWLKAAEAYAAEQNTVIDTEIRAGHVAQQLVRAAEAHHADLLVMGASSHSAVCGRLIGTTAEKASLHAARCSSPAPASHSGNRDRRMTSAGMARTCRRRWRGPARRMTRSSMR